MDWQGQGFIGREELLDECERLEKMEDVKIELGLWEFEGVMKRFKKDRDTKRISYLEFIDELTPYNLF